MAFTPRALVAIAFVGLLSPRLAYTQAAAPSGQAAFAAFADVVRLLEADSHRRRHDATCHASPQARLTRT